MFRHTYTYPIILILLFLAASLTSHAQLPSCNNPKGARNGYIYYLQNALIWQLDPTKPPSASNPSVNTIRPPALANGIAIGINMFQGQPRATFYCSDGWGNYWYYNGTGWVNTGHKSFGASPGCSDQAIFNVNDSTGRITKYTGSGDAQITATYWERGIHDFAGDCAGNIYSYGKDPEFFPREEDSLFIYDNNVNLIKKLPVIAHDTLFWDTTDGYDERYGFAIVEDKIYVDNKYGIWEGDLYADSVVFPSLPIYSFNGNWPRPIDWASCPIGGVGNLSAGINKTWDISCGMPDSVLFLAERCPTCVPSWSIVGGSPSTLTVNTAGDSAYVNTDDSVRIRLTFIDTYHCNKPYVFDADVIAANATVSAGADRHLIGCSPFVDTLDGSLTNTRRFRGIFYIIDWNPKPLYRFATVNRLQPEITINEDTFFVLTVFTPQHMGGCYWHDTVNVTVEDYREDNIDFDYSIRYGCWQDTVLFTNKTTTAYGPLTSRWFADTVLFSNTYDANTTYENQDSAHKVLLVTNNGYCNDSLIKEVDTRHPLKAEFNVAKEVPCVEQLVEYSADSSVIFQYPYGDQPEYKWSFHDYRFGEGKTIAHAFPEADEYFVKLIVKDGIGCMDSIEKKINVFGLMPIINLGPSDTVACEDHVLYLPFGNQGRIESYLWQDGSTDSVFHVVEPGTYAVSVSNGCGSIEDTINVSIGACKLWMPSAFSPNGDGNNDKFSVRSKNPETLGDLYFAIFNRKGNLMFETNAANDGWDGTYNGTPQPIGTYFYMIQYTLNGTRQLDKGDVTLVR